MKKGLMQYDPMTGMPVAQSGTPMFPVSAGFVGGSTAKFNPRINQYAQADSLANAAYASQPMPALAQKMRLRKIEGTLLPKQGAIGTLAPTEGVKTEVKERTMSLIKEDKAAEPTTGTKEYDKNVEFNKYAMETGISPNFDAMSDSARIKEMEKFYSNPANVIKMNKEQEKYYKNKPALKQAITPGTRMIHERSTGGPFGVPGSKHTAVGYGYSGIEDGGYFMSKSKVKKSGESSRTIKPISKKRYERVSKRIDRKN